MVIKLVSTMVFTSKANIRTAYAVEGSGASSNNFKTNIRWNNFQTNIKDTDSDRGTNIKNTDSDRGTNGSYTAIAYL
jgi:hypothetical protein